MDPTPRHQCFIYSGPPNQHLRPIAKVICEKLKQGYRCIYLNSEPMVAGMRSYLAAAGADVEAEVGKSSLVLSSERPHLVEEQFKMDGMLEGLESELERALRDGYTGLFATGDMTWEMGPDQDMNKLTAYEQSLEEFFHAHPQMSGICQYHANTLPKELLDRGLRLHRALFINETLSVLNSQYSPA